MQSGKFARGYRLLLPYILKVLFYLKLCIDTDVHTYIYIYIWIFARVTRTRTRVRTYMRICAPICIPRLSRLSLLFHIGISRESDVPRLYRRSQVPLRGARVQHLQFSIRRRTPAFSSASLRSALPRALNRVILGFVSFRYRMFM